MSSRNNGLICSICLKRLRRCRLGKPLVCSHVFCFTCIFEWAKVLTCDKLCSHQHILIDMSIQIVHMQLFYLLPTMN